MSKNEHKTESGDIEHEAAETAASQQSDAQESDGSGGRNAISLEELRERARSAPKASPSELTQRLSAAVSKPFDDFNRQVDSALKFTQSPAITRLAEQQAAMAKWGEQNRVAMEDLSTSIAEQKQREEQRADAQAEATLDIARAQQRLQDLQAQGVELATAQAEATAEVARAQQETLAAIHEELDVLRQQHATLEEQVDGQRSLISASWAGGVIMEWTLLVAVIAAVASVALGVAGDRGITIAAWISFGVAVSAACGVLTISQIRRKP
ncbi:hypothetical protein [Nocardioides sp.]|uniref:hypothetical protein n=1 Tax=Nocardioides sp. TaxID=35761 RepID=UPI0019C7DF6A|nr:hypothetical protein [Nocardioides sp.]MBC7274967.1 hypothetical protein [Nocardioides sp.]